MEQRLSIITLGVSDLEKSKAFYDALGWRAANENTDEVKSIVAYNLNGLCLALFPLDKLAEDARVQLTKTHHSSFTLAYNVNAASDVDKTLQEVDALGGTIVKQAQNTSWGGYSGYFSDPDGYLWEVAHNPFASLGEDGSFRW